MAKVVHRRKSPPYALIIFVFLFLVATALAVVFYNKLDKSGKELADVKQTLVHLAGEASGGQYPYMGDYPKQLLNRRAKGELDQTVTVKLNQDADDVRKMVARKEHAGTTELVREQFRAMVEAHRPPSDPSTPSVIPESKFTNAPLLEQLDASLKLSAAHEKDIAARKKQLDAERARADSFRTKAGELSDSLKAVEAAKTKEIQDVEAKFVDYQGQQARKLAEAMKTWQDDREANDNNIAKLSEKVARQEKSIRELELIKRNLLEQLKPKVEARSVPSLAMGVDGKVLRVIPGEDICYVNLGRDHRVMPGLTLSIFSPGKGPVTKDLPKGTLVVTNVQSGLSECRIQTVADKLDPISVGDPVFNIVFDPNKTFTFIVEGKFDLQGGDRPSDMGATQVAELIKKYRGRLGKVDVIGVDPKDPDRLIIDLDPETDFVVIGSEPLTPPPPPDGAPESVLAAYKEQRRIYMRYRAIRLAAVRIGIPMLNTNRFLSLVGYTPKPIVE